VNTRNESWLAVAYFTRDQLYEKVIQNLYESFKKQGVAFDSYSFENPGSWLLGTRLKPGFILDMMRRHPDKNIVYIDADAVLNGYPDMFNHMRGDLAAYHHREKEYATGTLYFKNTARVQEFVQTWIGIQDAMPELPDGPCYNKALTMFSDLHLVKLPMTYCSIFDLPDAPADAVIVHNQASRRARAAEDKYVRKYPSLRLMIDGSYKAIRRLEPAVESQLDSELIRVGRGRWAVRRVQDILPTFRDKHVGCHGFIFGKGPGLDKVCAETLRMTKLCTRNNLHNCVLFTINEAVHKIESIDFGFDMPLPIYAVQQDIGLMESCWPSRGTLLLSQQCRHFYTEHPKRFIYDARDLGERDTSLSAFICIKFAQLMGITSLTLVGFDAMKDNPDCTYAAAVGKDPKGGGNPERFISHARRIKLALAGFPHEILFL
jgi:hypothetical protein